MAQTKESKRRNPTAATSETFLLRLPPELLETVRASAQAEGRPVSTEIRFILEDYYAAHHATGRHRLVSAGAAGGA